MNEIEPQQHEDEQGDVVPVRVEKSDDQLEKMSNVASVPQPPPAFITSTAQLSSQLGLKIGTSASSSSSSSYNGNG